MNASPFRGPGAGPERDEETADSGLKVRDVMSRRVVTIEEADSIALATQVMLWNGVHHLPVVRRGALVGVLSDHDILRPHAGNGGRSRVVAELMTSPAEDIGPDIEIERAAARMVASGIGSLPVVEGGTLIGIVTTTDLLALLASGQPVVPSAPEAPVEAAMTPDPVTVTPGTRVLDALADMVSRGVRHLPVVTSDGKLVGILSERDLRSAIGLPAQLMLRIPGSDLRRMSVEDVMTPDPVSVRPTTPLSAATRLLADERFGALPVVDEQKRVVGILSTVDVFREIATRPR